MVLKRFSVAEKQNCKLLQCFQKYRKNYGRRCRQVMLALIKKPGTLHKLDPRCVHKLLNYVQDNGGFPLFAIASPFRGIDRERLPGHTLQRYQHRCSITRYVHGIELFLKEWHFSHRLNWCAANMNWRRRCGAM